MTENKKTMRILCGIFLLTVAGLQIIGRIVYFASLLRSGYFGSGFSPALRVYLLSSLRGWAAIILLIMTAIFILTRKFTGGGILQLLSGAVSLIYALIVVVGTLIQLLQYGLPRSGMITLVSGLNDIVSAAAVILFALAMFVRGKKGKILCIVTAIIGVITGILSAILPGFLAEGLSASASARMVGTSLLVNLIPIVMLLLAKVFLGVYFGANPKEN